MLAPYQPLKEILAKLPKKELCEMLLAIAEDFRGVEARIRLLAADESTPVKTLEDAYRGLFVGVQDNFDAEYKQCARLRALFAAVRKAKLEPLAGVKFVLKVYASLDEMYELTSYFEDLSGPFEYEGVVAFNYYARQLPAETVEELVVALAQEDQWDVAEYLLESVERGFADPLR